MFQGNTANSSVFQVVSGKRWMHSWAIFSPSNHEQQVKRTERERKDIARGEQGRAWGTRSRALPSSQPSFVSLDYFAH